ncbi:MAG: hypothetical protein LBS87_01355 [Puniceicoccales bacterium]|jgi:hypothetical protein|nr:hypothetical protein [Puniceicoccales bacterium]
MKKVAMITAGLLSLGCLGAGEIPPVSMDASVRFSTEHVFRGRKQGAKVFVPNVELGVPLFDKGRVYVGCSAALGVDNKTFPGGTPTTRNEFGPYVGVSYDITDMFSLDAGYIHRFYSNDPKEVSAVTDDGQMIHMPFYLKGESNELYVGVMADVLLSPSVYFFYNFDCKEAAIEGRVAYTYDLGQFGISNTAIELGAQLGYDHTERPFAAKKETAKAFWGNDASNKKNYLYYGAKADLVYSFNEHAKARAGVEFAGNSAKKKSVLNFYSDLKHRSFVWFNASVDCSF